MCECFTNTYGNDEKAGNLREIPQNGQGVKWSKKKLGNGTMALKCKGFLKEDIPNTTLEHLIKEINKK